MNKYFVLLTRKNMRKMVHPKASLIENALRVYAFPTPQLFSCVWINRLENNINKTKFTKQIKQNQNKLE